jgi:hypothetical protein
MAVLDYWLGKFLHRTRGQAKRRMAGRGSCGRKRSAFLNLLPESLAETPEPALTAGGDFLSIAGASDGNGSL